VFDPKQVAAKQSSTLFVRGDDSSELLISDDSGIEKVKRLLTILILIVASFARPAQSGAAAPLSAAEAGPGAAHRRRSGTSAH